MSDFFDVSSQDLDVPEILLFTVNDAVEFTILSDIKEKNGDKPYIMLPCRVETGEHKGRVHQFYVRKNDKRTFAAFLQAFWKRDEIIKGEIVPSYLVGRSFRAKALALNEYQGKTYQSLSNFQDLGIVIRKENDTDIPF